MVNDLGVPLDHLERATPLISGFLLGYVVAIPLFGPLSDSRGRSLVFLGALAVFAIGSVVTARAEELNTLIAGRAIQGFAGGALVPVSLALVADTFPAGSARLLALGVAAGAQEVGSLIGPVYGAAVAQWGAAYGGWRAVFWINLPLTAICAGAFLVAGRNRPPAPAAPTAAGLPAAAALGAGMGLLVLALYPDDPTRSALGSHFLPLLAGAVAALGVFAVLQWQGLGRLLSATAARSRQVRAGIAVNVLVGAALVAALAEVPVLASTLFGLDQTGSALLLARFLAGVPVGALIGGQLGAASRRFVAFGGMALAAASFWRMSAWDAGEPLRHLGPFQEAHVALFACGLGFGFVVAPVAAAILDAARDEEHGAASSAAVLARTGGMLAGIAVLAAYGFHRLYGELATCPRGGGLGGFLSGPFIVCATGALHDQYHDVFLIAMGLCAAAAATALAWLQ